MIRFVVMRVLAFALLVLGMTAVMFVATYLLPADPARVAAGPTATEADVEMVRQRLGLDKPLPQQYWTYLSNLVHLNLGRSLATRQPIALELARAIPPTLELVVLSMLLTVAIAVPLGVIAAVAHSRWLDGAIRIFALLGTSTPPFWFALLLQLLFYKELGWLPVGGQMSVGDSPPAHITGASFVDSLLTGNWATLRSSARHLILPVASLAFGQLGVLTRMVRVQVRLELGRNYVRTARAKGLTERRIMYRHVLRNALIPILTQIGIQSGFLLTGAVYIEGIFRWPGLGSYALNAILNLDFPALTAVALVMAITFALISLMVDVTYTYIDPRVRIG